MSVKAVANLADLAKFQKSYLEKWNMSLKSVERLDIVCTTIDPKITFDKLFEFYGSFIEKAFINREE